jgi:hypothetical protein
MKMMTIKLKIPKVKYVKRLPEERALCAAFHINAAIAKILRAYEILERTRALSGNADVEKHLAAIHVVLKDLLIDDDRIITRMKKIESPEDEIVKYEDKLARYIAVIKQQVNARASIKG